MDGEKFENITAKIYEKEGFKFDTDIFSPQTQEEINAFSVEKWLDSSYLHEVIEKYYNDIDIKEFPPEFKFFEEFIKKYPSIKPYRTESRVFDSEASIAGTIDMVYEKPSGELFIFDWKRSTKLVNDIGAVIKSDFEYGFDELNDLSNNSYNKYCLQLNLYKYILEENYDKEISSMNLLVLHPKYHTFFHLKIPLLKKETDFLIRKARAL